MLAKGRQLAVLAIILFASSGVGQGEDLAAQVRAAKAAFRPLDQTDVAAAREDLNAAAAALESRFASAGESAEGWRIYLNWANVQKTLVDPTGPDLATLTETYRRLSSGHEGLGLVPFTGLRDAIRSYIAVAKGAEDPSVRAAFETVIARLADAVQSYNEDPSGEKAAMISSYLRWLSEARQTPELITAIRAASFNWNFYATVSEGVFDAAMGREVDRVAPVRDVILGTRIYGTGHTVGRVSVDLVPSQDRATIMTVMNGINTADTVGYNGPATIYASGTTNLTTSKQVLVDGQQLWTLPAQAEAITHSNIHSICANMRIVEKIAWKRARQQKCQADAIAAQHAEREARGQFDAEVEQQIAPANADIQTKVRKPLIERGLYPAHLNFSTTDDSFRFAVLQAGPLELGAPTEPPLGAADADLRVRVHETMVNNFASAALGGMLLEEHRVQEVVKEQLGELPKELESEEGSAPWKIAFQPARPVWVAFQGNQFTVSIRGRNFYEGDQRHPGMDVTVTYKIVGEGDGLKAVRQGDVEIFPPGFDPNGDKQLSAQETAIRRILQRRLGKLFEEEIIPEPLVLPNEWRRVGVMKLVQWEARDGWIVLSWKRTGEPAPPLEPETTTVALAP